MHHLMMISVIARQKNLTKAANEMGVTPSALSHRLAEAERRMGAANRLATVQPYSIHLSKYRLAEKRSINTMLAPRTRALMVE
jgi:hypothetical protein